MNGLIKVEHHEIAETTDKTLVCLDPDQNAWVTFGLPGGSLTDKEVIYPPRDPHIIHAHEVVFRDPSHPDGIALPDLTIIYAHGAVDAHGIWRFQDGQEIGTVIEAYDNWRMAGRQPRIDFVLACNAGFITLEPDIPTQAIPRQDDVPIISAADAVISAYFGENSSRVTPQGIVRFVVSSQKDFFDLDRLADHLEIRNDIELIE